MCQVPVQKLEEEAGLAKRGVSCHDTLLDPAVLLEVKPRWRPESGDQEARQARSERTSVVLPCQKRTCHLFNQSLQLRIRSGAFWEGGRARYWQHDATQSEPSSRQKSQPSKATHTNAFQPSSAIIWNPASKTTQNNPLNMKLHASDRQLKTPLPTAPADKYHLECEARLTSCRWPSRLFGQVELGFDVDMDVTC